MGKDPHAVVPKGVQRGPNAKLAGAAQPTERTRA